MSKLCNRQIKFTSHELLTNGKVSRDISPPLSIHYKEKVFYDLNYLALYKHAFQRPCTRETRGRQVSQHPLASPFEHVYQWPNEERR